MDHRLLLPSSSIDVIAIKRNGKTSPLGGPNARKKKGRQSRWETGGLSVKGSGGDRLSRLGRYHGPDGLNGRVRNGNGCDPIGMAAGKAVGGQCFQPAGRDWLRRLGQIAFYAANGVSTSTFA